MDDWEVRLTVEELKDILDNLPADSEIAFQGLEGGTLEFHRCKEEQEGLVRIELRDPALLSRTAIERRSKELFFPARRGMTA